MDLAISVTYQHSQNATMPQSSIWPFVFSFVHAVIYLFLTFTECMLPDKTSTTVEVSKFFFLH